MSEIRNAAEFDASAVLNEVWETNDGSRFKLPIDPIKIANSYGISVYENDFPPRISGAIVRTEEKGTIILLNKNDVKPRRRFTCAHEIGHYYKRMSSDVADDSTFEFIDLRGPLSSEGTDEDEIYANQFAASLLMPKIQVLDLHEKGRTIPYMIDEFRVSRDAMMFRLQTVIGHE